MTKPGFKTNAPSHFQM